MSDESAESGSAKGLDEVSSVPLSRETLVEAIYNSLSTKKKEGISRDDVADVVKNLKLDNPQRLRTPSVFRIHRLRFAGEKRLREQPPHEFEYDQTFAPGVNVICIPDNEVGKSSVLKTIKFALTGDDGDYDADVRSWIIDVWLVFGFDKQTYTLLHSSRGAARALLVPGLELRPLETVVEEAPHILFDATGSDDVRAELQRFFFRRFGLEKLSWTQQDASTPEGVAERSTSWLTYFQALHIPDGGDRYLLCDPQHAFGNQEGLIFSAFLGLHLVESLNQLGVEAGLIKKAARRAERDAAARAAQAQGEVERLEAELQGARERIRAVQEAQNARHQAVLKGEPNLRLRELQSLKLAGSVEVARLTVERDDLTRHLQHLRGHERKLREAIALRLHFTGLEVSLCPSCDLPVDAEAVLREQDTHECRLCGKPAHDADEAGLEALNAQAEELRRAIGDTLTGKSAIAARLKVLRRTLQEAEAETTTLTQVAEKGLEYALPTSVENAELEALYQQVGSLQAQLSIARREAEPPDEEETNEQHIFILDKVRSFLRGEAARRNHTLLTRLSALTQESTRAIGAESISDVSCSPLGRVELRKHGEKVSFIGIHNEGERLRIKLAFFLAMMRLGREAGLGRHPGFLLIDQPGSGEMVATDFEALAGIFQNVDHELAEQVQIICCTARPEFRAATVPGKVYGPQALPYAF